MGGAIEQGVVIRVQGAEIRRPRVSYSRLMCRGKLAVYSREDLSLQFPGERIIVAAILVLQHD